MRAVEVERAAAEKDAAIGLGDGEVANVFADLGEWALEQRAIGGERIHQIVDVGGVLKQGLTHQHGRPPAALQCTRAEMRFDARPGPVDAGARGSADHIVAVERGVQRDGGEEVLAKLGAELRATPRG